MPTQLDDFGKGLQDTFKRYWMPALAGAALGGGAATYLGRESGPEGETGGSRRKRMLRQALVGALLGGVTGMAIPKGYEVASAPWGTAKPLTGGPIDAAAGFVGRHAVPSAIGGAGTYAILKSEGNKERAAMADLFRTHVEGLDREALTKALPGLNAANTESLGAYLKANPDKIKVLQEMIGKTQRGDLSHKLRLDELFESAGLQTGGKPTVGELAKQMFTPGAKLDNAAAIREYLKGESGILGKTIAGMGDLGSANLGKRVAVNSEFLPEIYRRLIRPSTNFGMSLPGKLGLLGGAVLAGNEIQNKLLGR